MNISYEIIFVHKTIKVVYDDSILSINYDNYTQYTVLQYIKIGQRKRKKIDAIIKIKLSTNNMKYLVCILGSGFVSVHTLRSFRSPLTVGETNTLW